MSTKGICVEVDAFIGSKDCNCSSYTKILWVGGKALLLEHPLSGLAGGCFYYIKPHFSAKMSEISSSTFELTQRGPNSKA